MKSTKLSMDITIEEQNAIIKLLEKKIKELNQIIHSKQQYIQRLENLCDHHEIDTNNNICVGCYKEYKHDDNKVCSKCGHTDCITDGDALCADCNDE